MGCGRVWLWGVGWSLGWGTQVAGFEAFELFQRGVEGAAGTVDAVL